MSRGKMIGVVGGVGPYAGIDLVRKIHCQTKACRDQDHLSVVLLSLPERIEDRTSYLLGKTKVNPAIEICNIIRVLENIGAGVVGIPCNTAHAPQIFNVILHELKKTGSNVMLVHMIEEVVGFVRENNPGAKRVGVLSSTGVYETGVYKNALEKLGFAVIVPTRAVQEQLVHRSIYDPEYGIKAMANPVSDTARNNLFMVINDMRRQGAEAVILGCTEISLAIKESRIGDCVVVDSTEVLAKALVRQAIAGVCIA